MCAISPLPLCLSVSICASVSVALSVSVCFCLSVCLSVCLSLSVSVSLPPAADSHLPPPSSTPHPPISRSVPLTLIFWPRVSERHLHLPAVLLQIKIGICESHLHFRPFFYRSRSVFVSPTSTSGRSSTDQDRYL